MHARSIFVTLISLVWAAAAQAQPRDFERFREHFREREHGLPLAPILPTPRREEHVAVHHQSAKGDGPTCDNPDNDADAAIAACGRIITKGQIKGGYSLVIAYAHRGQAYENKADHDHAIADFSAAIRLKPTVAGYFALRGGAAEKSGNVDVAQSDFRQAMNLDPKNQDALNGLKRVETRSANVGGTTTPPAAANAAMPAAAAVAATTVVTTAAAATPVAAALPASTSNVAHGPRVALVIGNGAYVNANALPNPPNDAHAIAGVLREIGFDVVEGENLNRAAMENNLRDFLHRAANASIVLLFYAGHGMQVDGKNYLVPIDAKLAEASDLQFETIEIDKLLDQLGDPGHTNIILLDACRDNPLARSFASHLPATRSAAVAGGLAAYSAVGTGTLIAYATAPGQTALDGQGANSPFTTSLLHNIRTPGLEIRQVLTRVRAEVATETRNKQIPWDNSSLMGDVVLVRQDAPAATPDH